MWQCHFNDPVSKRLTLLSAIMSFPLYTSYETMVNILPGPRTADTPTKIYTGGCHCGRFKFECRHPILEKGFEVVSCNCSICTMKGFLAMCVDCYDFIIILIYKRKIQIHYRPRKGLQNGSWKFS